MNGHTRGIGSGGWSGLRIACFVTCAVGALAPSAAWAGAPPTTADTLQKLHVANSKEIAMGKQAIDRGTSNDVKALGRMLVKDHTAADKKVAELAQDEGISLSETVGTTDSDMLPAGDGYDAAFAKTIVDDHERDLADLTAVRDATSDPKLKRLLSDLLPTLRKHAAQARLIADRGNKS